MKRDDFTLSLNLGQELIIDNFAGGGGTSTGLEEAFGRPVDIAINHDPEALALHAMNHPHTKHLCESVWDVDPIKVTNNQPVGLVWLSPDCFPAGTLVMTSKGYRAIETIQVGDMVLTHKLRWRVVTECSSTVRPLIEIRGHGHPGLRVSPEHPFYTREQYRTWNNARRTYDHALRSAEWTPASAVQKGLYWGTPCTFPPATAPDVAGRGINMSEELLWLAGRYLGDGWTRLTDTRAEVVITCGMHEVERLRDLLNRWPRAGSRAVANELEWHERVTSTAYQFTTSHRGLVKWLRENFGHRAESKGIPAWALGLSHTAREALLEGYLSADGHKFDDFVEAHTVSKSLAFGIKALANSLGKTVAVYCRPNSNVIDGREVNARDLFKVRWRHAVHAEHAQTYIEDGIEWCPVREQSASGESAEVFNIGVDEDESYVVEGIIVHNCKHFSKAKGGTPVAKNIRGLAWVTLRWAAKCKPRVIMLENVEEFKTWGPLIADAEGNFRPDPAKKGKTFESFLRQLRGLGYTVDHKELRASDYDTPTIRKRFFLVARRDGLPIRWPEPTNGAPTSPGVLAGKLAPWRTAAECIDWSIPCPSIFERKKPLAPATLRRIAKGIMRYVVDAEKPFIVGQGGPIYAGKPVSVDQPFGTLTTENHRAIVVPSIVPVTHQGSDRNESVHEPFRTITGAQRGEKALATTTLVPVISCNCGEIFYGSLDIPCPKCGEITSGSVNYIERSKVLASTNKAALVTAFLNEHANGSNQRVMAIDEPLRTICAQVKGGHFSAVTAELAPFVMTNTTGHPGTQIELPVPTVTAAGNQALVTAHITKFRTGATGSDMLEPVPTITAGPKENPAGAAHALGIVTAHIQRDMGQSVGHSADTPLATVTAGGGGKSALVASSLVKLRGTSSTASMEEPLHTVSAGGQHHAEVRAFLLSYYGSETDADSPSSPLRTVTSRERFGLVTIQGVDYQIVDIGLRMLDPGELYRAQGFPESYVIREIPDPDLLFKDGHQAEGNPLALPRIPLTKSAQVRMCGNSVCPPMARALINANFMHERHLARVA